MIFDLLENLHFYSESLPHWEALSDFLNRSRLSELPSGRTEISGDNLFVCVDEYSTETMPAARLETHLLYIDLQIVISGRESSRVSPARDLLLEEAYDPAKEAAFYRGCGEEGVILLKPGVFAVFMPDDAHQPRISVNQPEKVKKAVFKIRRM
ncbi:MAG: YhcH/YjgK/YiaL family protein [Candidatus Wallbacteria bacterium]|nr:YhcH/YjgK/YiaL family protein [Candidatus Wallbacteria bacterium]